MLNVNKENRDCWNQNIFRKYDKVYKIIKNALHYVRWLQPNMRKDVKKLQNNKQ